MTMLFISHIQDTRRYYTPTTDCSVLQQCGLIGEGVRKPTFERYKVFVQSTGSGARHLPIGSMLLYEHVNLNPHNYCIGILLMFLYSIEAGERMEAPLVPITSNHFVVSKISRDCTVEDFCKEKKSLIRLVTI